MRILADENIETAVVDWMRKRGHDVKRIEGSLLSLDDKQVLAIAAAERRVLITYDRDFGDLIFRQRLSSIGVALLRFSPAKVAGRILLLEEAWAEIESISAGTFMVVSDNRIRIRRIELKSCLDDSFFEDDVPPGVEP